jgi:hypothetical protein
MAENQWITEDEASRILKLSRKRVRQLVAGGQDKIRIKRETNPVTKRLHTVYHAADIEKLQEERKDRIRAAKQRPGRVDSLSLPEGDARIELHETLSAKSRKELQIWLNLMKRKH